MRLPDKIRAAIETEEEDLLNWSSLLNFFEEHQSTLSKKQKIKIYNRCEKSRIYWNEDKTEIVKVHKAVAADKERVWIKVPVKKPGMGIKKEDVFPNNIYTDKDIIRHLDKQQTIFYSLLQTIFQVLSIIRIYTVGKKPTYVNQ